MFGMLHTMVQKLIVAKKVVIETKNDTKFSSGVCALMRKKAVDEMHSCAADAKMKTSFRLNEQLEADPMG